MKAMRHEWLSVMMAGLGLGAALPSFGGGMFSASGALGNGNLDASIGLNSGKTYKHAYNIRGGDVTVNGVGFTGVPNFAGVDGVFGMSGWNMEVGNDGSDIGSGSGLNTLLKSFNYHDTGSPETLTLLNLEVGQAYILTFYNKAWGSAGGQRIQSVTTSSGAATVFDENMGGEPNANLLRYTFTATNATEWVSFARQGPGSFHFYGFSTEQVFNNVWGSGADWTSATWGKGVPNAAGANANFTSQGAPTAINLDAPVTVGHIQFDGANAWTLSGASPLTLQADVGGVSVLSTPAGSHTITTAITLNNDLMKVGAGALTLAGPVSGPRVVTIAAGTLEITAPNTLPAGTAVEIAAGAVLKLSNAGEQTVTGLTFDGKRQTRGTWGAPGSGAQFTSARFGGTGVLRVLVGPVVGLFTASGDLGGGDLDASIGVSTNKTYLNAVNTFGDPVTINGVPFAAGPRVANPSGATYSTDNFGNFVDAGQGTIGGNLKTLVEHFNYGNGTTPQTFTLTTLTTGQTYILTFYNRAWSAYDNRTQSFSAASGATTTFNEDNGAQHTANLLRYTFVASSPAEVVTITPQRATFAFHLYGFSTEQVFNNAWSSGADWSTATWGTPGAPNSRGASANFTAQGSPTAVNLDTPVTVGHLQFDSVNPWTVTGANPLTLWADVGGVSVLNVPAGSHTLSAAVTLNNDVVKVGSGALTMKMVGDQPARGNILISEGTLRVGVASNVPPASPVAFYRFDGTASDATGKGHDGTLEGAGTSYDAGRSASAGQALNFTGGQDVTVGYSPDFALNTFTVSAWVKLNTPPGGALFGILGTRFGGETTFDLKVMSEKVHGDIGSGGGWLNTSVDFSGSVPAGEWHMITYVVDGGAGQARLYYDGALTNTLGFSGTPLLMKAGQSLKIGQSSPGEYMNGQLDDVAIYGAALTSDQVARLFSGEIANPLPYAASVTVAAGATLDLGGNAQTLNGLTGSGLVTNGALTVTGLLSPGGSNTVGTLTLALPTTLSGATLLADVTSGGACDLLRVQGDLNVSGSTLQVVDTGLLNIQQTYTVAKCTGSLSGKFNTTNLVKPWFARVDPFSREVKVVFSSGTMILVF